MPTEQDDITKQIEARLEQLPEDIRNAILASDFDQKIQAIGKAHNLHIDQSQQLGNETLLVMLGVSPMSGFSDDIAREVRISKGDADKIIADINAQIFAPIRESMKHAYEEASAPAEPAEMNPPAMNMSSSKSVVMPSRAAAMQTPDPLVPPVPPMRPGPAMPPTPATPPLTPPMSPPSAPPVVPPMGMISSAAQPIQIGPTTQLSGMPKPAVPVAPAMHAADVVLTQKTVELSPAPVQTAPAAAPASASAASVPPKPQPYKADPYREPIEP
ncbi:MAG TPA: hypothetical protein VG753_00690 [Candidatus Paceibacterota bacterium]|nr:hypothetical protein [Candidatus Paceibacterota bacterium]